MMKDIKQSPDGLTVTVDYGDIITLLVVHGQWCHRELARIETEVRPVSSVQADWLRSHANTALDWNSRQTSTLTQDEELCGICQESYPPYELDGEGVCQTCNRALKSRGETC